MTGHTHVGASVASPDLATAPAEVNFADQSSPVRGVSRTVYLLSMVSLLTDMSSEMIYPLLPAFIAGLGGGAAAIGIIEGVAETTASIGKLFSGWLADRVGKRKPLVMFGYGLSSLTRPMVALALAPWHVVVIRFIDRIGKGIRSSPRDLLINDSATSSTQGRAFSFHRAMDHLGAAVGTLGAFAVLSLAPRVGYRTIFWFAAIPAAAAVLTLVLGVKEIPPRSRPKQPPTITLRPFDLPFKGYLAILLLFTLANSSDMFLLWAARLTGVPDIHLPLLWFLLHIVKTVTSTPAGTISDRVGRRTFIVAGWVLYGLVYLGFGLARSPGAIWLLFAVYGAFAGLTEGAEKALVGDLTPPEHRGVAFGMYNFTVGIGLLPASLLMGFLLQQTGRLAAFGAAAAIALFSAVVLSFWLGKHARGGAPVV